MPNRIEKVPSSVYDMKTVVKLFADINSGFFKWKGKFSSSYIYFGNKKANCVRTRRFLIVEDVGDRDSIRCSLAMIQASLWPFSSVVVQQLFKLEQEDAQSPVSILLSDFWSRPISSHLF